MARVPYLDAGDLGPADRDLLGRPINLFRALANSPDALRRWQEFGDWIRWQSALDPRLRELAIIAVGVFERSEYEFTHHVKIARDFGVAEADITAVIAWQPGLPTELGETEVTVLNGTLELTRDGRLGAERWRQLEDRLGTRAALELVVIVGFYAMVVRVLAALQVDVEEDYAVILGEHPLP